MTNTTVGETRTGKIKGNAEASAKQKAKAILILFTESRALFYRGGVVAKEVHGKGKFSGGLRGVLFDLDHHGPQTVPQMARARPVSRQHMQSHVNELLGEGLVELIDNPAHKRSRLVRLTRQGQILVDAMKQREGQLLTELPLSLTTDEMLAAAEVLRTLRESFESVEWQQLLEDAEREAHGA
jgi:DNA-binding MarR family transcriptional regulator